MEQDPLHLVKVDKWSDLEKAFELDYPRGITGYNVLQTQRRWLEHGVDYGFKVMCPFGDAKNGMVAVLNEDAIYQLHVECPNDTTEMEQALKTSKLINWDRDIHILFPPSHVVECVKQVIQERDDCEISNISSLKLYLLDRNTPLFDISLPSDFTFQHLTPEYIELIDSKWPHRFPGSESYFHLLLKAKSGFGLFRNQTLVTFGFIKETGALGHIYTLEEHRRNGYVELFLKMLCNNMLKEGRHINSYCVSENTPSCNLHEKLGFQMAGVVYSVYIEKKIKE